MTRVLIMGAGGHGQVVADILLRQHDAGSDTRPIGYLDDDFRLHGKSYLDLPVLGAFNARKSIPHDAVIVAVGDNRSRSEIFNRLIHDAERFVVAVHPRAVVASDVTLGPGTVVCAGAVINLGTTVGANAVLNTACSVDHHSQLGAHTHIAPGVHMGGEVEVREGTLVGIGATVMPGCEIGVWSVVGAGALVCTSVPDNVMAYGVPAKVVRHREQA